VAKRDDLEQRRLDQLTDELATTMADHLPVRGVVIAQVTDLDNVDRWRAAARRAARRLGVPVRTGISLDGSTAWVVDNSPRDEAEDDETMARMAELLDRLDPAPGRPSLRVVDPG
jgi:hypothetical protein